MAVSRVSLNRKAIGQILVQPYIQPALNNGADAVLKEAAGSAAYAPSGYEESWYLDEKIEKSGGVARRKARATNNHPLAWVVEFGSYGGGRSYELDERGPFPGYTDEGGPQRQKRSTGQGTGNVGPQYVLTNAALAASGQQTYKPRKLA